MQYMWFAIKSRLKEFANFPSVNTYKLEEIESCVWEKGKVKNDGVITWKEPIYSDWTEIIRWACFVACISSVNSFRFNKGLVKCMIIISYNLSLASFAICLNMEVQGSTK